MWAGTPVVLVVATWRGAAAIVLRAGADVAAVVSCSDVLARWAGWSGVVIMIAREAKLILLLILQWHNQCCQIPVYSVILLKSSGKYTLKAATSC
jgi:hypothetical protein